MVNYTLTYFPLRAYGEYIRLLFKDNDIAFEDYAIPIPDWRPKHKQNYPYKQLPVLTEDGKVICQTGAILRHLARIYDLYGSTEDERTFLDSFFDGLRDLRAKYMRIMYEEYEKKPEYVNETLPTELAIIETQFKTHKNGEGFVLGDKISFVDYALFEELDVANTSAPGSLDAFPALKAFHQRFQERPRIKEHIKTRFPAINGVDYY